MANFKEGDKVTLVIRGMNKGEGIVKRVGDTFLYCMDDDGNTFHSHTENFVHAKPFAETKAGPQIIGIAGRKGHGKDTAAQALDGYENVKFAAPLKDMIRVFLRYVGISEETVERCVEGDMKEIPLACFGGRSTRYAMQTLGTEWGRNLIWQDIWTNAFKDRANQFDKVVCTDMRFPNEVDTIKEMGGKTVRVRNWRKAVSGDEHPSETLIDDLTVDAQISNVGSIGDLHWKMQSIFAPPVLNNTDVRSV